MDGKTGGNERSEDDGVGASVFVGCSYVYWPAADGSACEIPFSLKHLSGVPSDLGASIWCPPDGADGIAGSRIERITWCVLDWTDPHVYLDQLAEQLDELRAAIRERGMWWA